MSLPGPVAAPATPERWLHALTRVLARVTAASDRQDVPAALMTGIVEELGVPLAALWFYDPADDALHLRAVAGVAGYREQAPERIVVTGGRAPLVRVFRGGEAVLIDDVRDEPGFNIHGWLLAQDLTAYAGLPLLLGGRAVGVLVVFLHQPCRPPLSDALAALAQQAALALEHARLLDESHSLQVIAAEIAAAPDSQALMAGLVERTVTALGADAGAVWLYQGGDLDVAASRGLSDAFFQHLFSDPTWRSRAIFEQIQRTRTPLYTPDDQAVARAHDARSLLAALEEERIVSALRLPLFAPGGEVVGMLGLYHRRERHYSAGEIQLAQAFTDQIAVALHNARLTENEREARAAAARQLARVGTLAEITGRLLGTADLQAVLRVVTEAAVRLCGAKGAVISLVDASHERMSPAASHGELHAWFETFSATKLNDAYRAETPTGQAIARRQPVLLTDYADHPVLRPAQAATIAAGVRSFIAAPVMKGEVLLGVLWVADTTPGSLTPDDAALVQALADQAALALEQARLNEESHALQAIAAELASTRDLADLLAGIVERTRGVLAADAMAVWLLDDDGLIHLAAQRGFSERMLARLSARLPLSVSELRRDDLSGRSFFVRDARTASAMRESPLALEAAEEGIVSVLRLPLRGPRGQAVGSLALYHRRERHYSPSEIRLAQAFADQIAVALHNARLAENERAAREAVARQVERLTALSSITEQLLAAPDLDAVLNVVVEAGRRLCNADFGMVGLIDDQRTALTPVAAQGEPGEFFRTFQTPTLDEAYMRESATGQAIARGQIVVVEDYAQWPRSVMQQNTVDRGLRAFIAAPLRIGDTVIGVLWVGGPEPRAFAAEDVALMATLADQAALAIEHTRLSRRSQAAAVLEERARLARDLHDSVTQSVFSLGMMARAAQAQHERGAPALSATLARIGALAQEALTEMRALLFELQPAGLAEEGLPGALAKLVAAARVRYDLNLSLTGTIHGRLPVEAETAVFRIVQEAIGNAAKHARASQVTVTLADSPDRVHVTVEDDGQGFDPAAPVRATADGRSGGLGLRFMGERAAAAGVTLRIVSAPGAGTRIVLEAPRTRPPASA